MDDVIEAMASHIEAHLAYGGKLHQVTRHMLGLFSGQPGARAWRRYLSEYAPKNGADAQVLRDAYDLIKQAAETAQSGETKASEDISKDS